MAYIFGLSNTSPSVLGNLLVTKRIVGSLSDLAVVPVDTVLSDKKPPTRSVLLIVTISDFLRNMEVLNSKKYRDCKVFVFASPLRLIEITNIVNLDITNKNGSKGFGFTLLPTDKIDWAAFRKAIKVHHSRAPEVYRDERDHLTYLTESVKKGSLLTPLMTFIYSLPSGTLQTPVKLAVARIIIRGLPISNLDSMVAKACEYEISANAKDRLVEILESDIGKKYFDSFAYYRETKKEKGSVAIAAVAKKFDTSAYELRYLLEVAEGTRIVKPEKPKDAKKPRSAKPRTAKKATPKPKRKTKT